MIVQQIPLTKQQIKVKLQEIHPWFRNPPKTNWEREKRKEKKQFTVSKQLNKKTYMAPNESFLWQTMTQKVGQSVALAPMNPKNLDLTEYKTSQICT
jgi:hypothetical protein